MAHGGHGRIAAAVAGHGQCQSNAGRRNEDVAARLLLAQLAQQIKAKLIVCGYYVCQGHLKLLFQ